jgi:hypothetical protein
MHETLRFFKKFIQNSGFFIKKGCLTAAFFNNVNAIYLFITYIVTSKPKRISVAAGLVHMIIFLLVSFYIRCRFNISATT